MTSLKRRPVLAISAALVLLLVTGHPQAQNAVGGEHWVGTWATAEVGRPQFPVVSPLPPVAPGALAAPITAPPPFMHFNNQTLRQIVRSQHRRQSAARRLEQ